MKNQEHKTRARVPYSTPKLSVESLGNLAARILRTDGGNRRVAGRRSARLATPPPLIVDGFESSVKDVVEVLSSLNWCPRIDSAAQVSVAPADPPEFYVHDGVSILVLDVRRRHSDSREPLTWISTGSGTSQPLTLILCDPGDDFRSAVEACAPERWHFSGTIDATGIGVLIKSVFQLLRVLTEASSNPGSVPELDRSRTVDVAYSERN